MSEAKPRYEIVEACEAHCVAIGPHLRQADRDEVAASCGLEPAEALLSSLRRSAMCWAGLVDGEPVCVFGVGGPSLMSEVGVPWLLGTDAVVKHQRAFLRRNKAIVAKMLDAFPVLINMVDARNVHSIRWLRWLGFHIGEPFAWGVEGRPFHPFSMRAADV